MEIQDPTPIPAPPRLDDAAFHKGMIPPRKIRVLERTLADGATVETEVDVWLIWESPESAARIVRNRDGLAFGLIAPEIAPEALPVLRGWHEEFRAAFLAM